MDTRKWKGCTRKTRQDKFYNRQHHLKRLNKGKHEIPASVWARCCTSAGLTLICEIHLHCIISLDQKLLYEYLNCNVVVDRELHTKNEGCTSIADISWKEVQRVSEGTAKEKKGTNSKNIGKKSNNKEKKNTIQKLAMRKDRNWYLWPKYGCYVIPFGNLSCFLGSIYEQFPLLLNGYQISGFSQRNKTPRTASHAEHPTLLPGIILNAQKILSDTCKLNKALR